MVAARRHELELWRRADRDRRDRQPHVRQTRQLHRRRLQRRHAEQHDQDHREHRDRSRATSQPNHASHDDDPQPHNHATSTTKPPGAPTLTWVSETHKRWRETNRDAVSARTTARRPPVGTNFSFTLNEAARIAFVFMSTEARHRVGRKCQAQSHTRRHPHCRRTPTRGTLTYTANAGRHRLAFQGRLVARPLPLGAYTVTLTATNASGQSSPPHTLRFTIVR